MSPTASVCYNPYEIWPGIPNSTASKTESIIDSYYIDIKELGYKGYYIKIPIKVIITKAENEIIGEIEDIETYAFGKNENQVLRELKSDLIDLFSHYSQAPDEKLGKNPKKWKDFLTEHIKKV